MVTSVNSNTSLLNYLNAQLGDGSSAPTTSNAASQAVDKAAANAIPQAALQRAASTGKAATAAHQLETAQKMLSTDLRAAMAKAGIKLSGPIEFSVKSDGGVDMKGSDADKAAVKSFLKADTSQPSFAARIANQAQDAMKLSSTIQQSAAISQAAKLAKTSGGVMSLYTSLMQQGQQGAASTVVFSVSPTSSSLSYPGSLTASA